MKHPLDLTISNFKMYWYKTNSVAQLQSFYPSKGLITLAGLAQLAGLVSVCRDLGTFVKSHKNQLHDYMTTGPVRLAEIPTNRADIFP